MLPVPEVSSLRILSVSFLSISLPKDSDTGSTNTTSSPLRSFFLLIRFDLYCGLFL